MKLIMLSVILFFSFLQNCFCNEIAKTPDAYTARGIIATLPYRAQENTLDAILAVKKWNNDHPEQKIAGSEIHVVVVDPKNPSEQPIFVCSHDENLQDLTGQNINLHDLTRSQIEQLQIKQVLYGIDYGKPRQFAFLEQVLDGVMKDTPFMLWIGVKDHNYQPSSAGAHSYTAVELVKALKTWQETYLRERSINIFNYIIISSTNPYILEELLTAAKTYHVEGLNILPDYSDNRLPYIIWQKFFEYGGYEKAYHFSPRWVSLQSTLITKNRIREYHEKGIKVMCWDACDSTTPYYNLIDAALFSY